MRVLLVTDSLGLPRPGVPPEATWTHMLAKDLWREGSEAVLIGQRGLTMEGAFSRVLSEISDYQADVVILQIGIVDCCRRPYSNTTRKILERSAFVRRWIGRNRYEVTRRIGRPAVTPDVFSRSLSGIAENCRKSGRGLAVVEIAPPGPSLVSQIYGVEADVTKYNSILQRVAAIEDFTYLSPYGGLSAEELTLPQDGHHLTVKGHLAVYNTAREFLAAVDGL